MKTKSFLQLKAYECIKDQILSGELQPGTLYSETKLSSQIGVSRTPMREALQCLSQDGYITIVPSKGFQIRELTEADMMESIQVRCAIEGYCTTVIASEIHTAKGRAALETLEALIGSMEAAAKSLDTDPEAMNSFIDYDHKFHLTVVEYLDNSEFIQLFQRLMYMIHLTSSNALSRTGRLESTMAEHRDYLKSLEDGNGHQAYELLIRHLRMPIEITEKNSKSTITD